MLLSNTKELHICPIKSLYSELEKNLPDRKTIAILISTEDVKHSNLRFLDACCKISAVDTETENNPFSFNRELGEKVKMFLDKENDFGRLYICCDSGESRSTAMAAAVMKYYGKMDREIWTNPHYHPNLLVYKVQMEVFGRKIKKLRLRYLKYVNNRALKKAINAKG